MEKNWHQLETTEVLREVKSRPEGLSTEEAAKRLQEFGRNELEEKAKKSKLAIFLSQFKDVMILILLAAAIISGLVGDLKDTLVISFIVIINAIVGYIQEF